MLGMDITSLVFLASGMLSVLALVVLLPIGVMLMQRQQARLKEQEHALKREMLARGMSVDEIERVIRASADKVTVKAESPEDDAGRLKGPGFDKTRLVQALIDQGMDA